MQWLHHIPTVDIKRPALLAAVNHLVMVTKISSNTLKLVIHITFLHVSRITDSKFFLQIFQLCHLTKTQTNTTDAAINGQSVLESWGGNSYQPARYRAAAWLTGGHRRLDAAVTTHQLRSLTTTAGPVDGWWAPHTGLTRLYHSDDSYSQQFTITLLHHTTSHYATWTYL